MNLSHKEDCPCGDCFDDCPYLVIGRNMAGGHQRGNTIGASDAPRLLGLDPHISARDAFGAFVMRESTPPNVYTEEGGWFEEPVMMWAAERTGRPFLPWQDRLRSRRHQWLSATPDGSDGETGLVEVKCTTRRTFETYWKGRDTPPDKVVCQVQLQLYVTGRRTCAVLHKCEGQYPSVRDVPRDERLIMNLVTSLEAIWNQVLEARKRLELK